MLKYEDRELDLKIPAPPHITFQGLVSDCTDSKGLDETVIRLTPVRIENGGIVEIMTAETDSRGMFSIPDLYQGLYFLEIMRGGYSKIMQNLYIPDPNGGVHAVNFCINEQISLN